MPYTEKKQRQLYKSAIIELANILAKQDDEHIVGDINFINHALIKTLIQRKGGMRYFRLNNFIGSIFMSTLELYRRLAGPYEEEAMKRNGDVEVW